MLYRRRIKRVIGWTPIPLLTPWQLSPFLRSPRHRMNVILLSVTHLRSRLGPFSLRLLFPLCHNEYLLQLALCRGQIRVHVRLPSLRHWERHPCQRGRPSAPDAVSTIPPNWTLGKLVHIVSIVFGLCSVCHHTNRITCPDALRCRSVVFHSVSLISFFLGFFFLSLYTCMRHFAAGRCLALCFFPPPPKKKNTHPPLYFSLCVHLWTFCFSALATALYVRLESKRERGACRCSTVCWAPKKPSYTAGVIHWPSVVQPPRLLSTGVPDYLHVHTHGASRVTKLHENRSGAADFQ